MTTSAARLWAGVILSLAALPGPAAAAPDRSPQDNAPHSSVEEARYIIVIVRAGDTLFKIARSYGVTVDAIIKANGLRNPDAIRVGQTLLIPLPAGPATGSQPQTPRGAASQPEYQWPASGPIMSGFGTREGRRHDGIDISSKSGTPIVAARAGVVTHAGWYYDYGLTVILDHGGGVTTIYGHTSAILVQAGQKVRAGEEIARVGCSGRCTGSHVHFEVRVQGRAVDPLAFLMPSARAAAQTLPAAGPSARPVPAPQPLLAPDQMEVERATRGGVTIVRYVKLADDMIVMTEDTFLRGELVTREEDIIAVRDGRRFRTKKIYTMQNGRLTLVAEDTVALDDPTEDSD